ncbi:MAG: flagellar M-ring protein [Rhodothalassiaceae bacterium]|nr:MAG: flagellar M-ring protein [Rhodothalassiaceae bacterium]
MNRFLQILASFGTARLIAMTAIVLGIIAFFFFVSMRLSQPPMSLLYADLDIAESGRIVERLEAMKVPYRLEDGGRSIFVPQDRVAQLRVTLAGEGLGGNVVGYEIFDRSEGLGTTSFVQRINRLRAIEGELARTIQEIKSVRAARVHIVMPERELFSRTAPEPSASIVLRTTTRLSGEQVAAIEHLVAAAVPGLSPSKISIVDQNGTLLARAGDDGADAAAATLDEKRVSLENMFRQRIEQLLEKAVGPGKVRAQVAVELDPSAATINEEIFDPDAAVVRSTRTIEETSAERKPGETPVSVDTNLPGNETSVAAAENLNQTQKTDETVNYEISRTVRTLVKERGAIQRISAAVLVDGHHAKNEAGEDVFTPLSDAEIEKLAALVRTAIGYDASRGDSVEVVSMSFVEPEIEPLEIEQPFRVFGLDKQDLYRIVEVAVFGIVAIFVLLLVVRPLVNRLVQAIPEATPVPQLAGAGAEALAAGDVEAGAALPGAAGAAALPAGAQGAGRVGGVPAVGGQGGVDAEGVEEQIQESVVRKIGEIVNKHPDEATAIIRTWLYAEE